MARVFVRLRLRLLANGLRGRGPQVIGVVALGTIALVLAAAGFATTAAARTGDAPDVVAVLALAVVVVAWLTLPLVGFGSGSTVEPQALVSLPLRRRQLMPGLLVADLVGPGAAITAATAAGAVVGLVDRPALIALVVLAAAVQVLVCVALARATTTFLSTALRSRRGRDLRLVAVFVVALLPQALRFVTPSDIDLDGLRETTDVLAWVPPLWPVRAMVALGRGDLLAGLGLLVGSAAVLAGLLAWWAASLDRLLTTPEVGSGGKRKAPVATSDDPLFGRLLGWLPRTALGAVAARELRLTWRDPRRRIGLLAAIILPVVIVGGFVGRGGLEQPAVVYVSLALVLFANRGFNQLGVDGREWTVHEAAGSDLRQDLDGKALAAFTIQAVEVVVVALVLAVPSGGWAEVLPAVVFAVALSGAQLGIGNLVSVTAPIPVPPATSSNVWATSSPGAGCLAGLLALGGMAGMVVVSAPFAVGAVLVGAPGWRLAIALVALPVGALLYRALTALAVQRGADRRPELLATLVAARA